MADIATPVLKSEPQWLRDARILWPILTETERAEVLGYVSNGRPKRTDPGQRRAARAAYLPFVATVGRHMWVVV